MKIEDIIGLGILGFLVYSLLKGNNVTNNGQGGSVIGGGYETVLPLAPVPGGTSAAGPNEKTVIVTPGKVSPYRGPLKIKAKVTVPVYNPPYKPTTQTKDITVPGITYGPFNQPLVIGAPLKFGGKK